MHLVYQDVLVYLAVFIVWGVTAAVMASTGLGRDTVREGPGVILDHELEEREDEQYRKLVAAKDANPGPRVTTRQRLAGHALTAASVVVSILACIVLVPKWGLIPIIGALLTILAGSRAGQRLPGHLARRQAKRQSPTPPSSAGYSPVS